ncbi:hypothetical protein NL676_024641 [Syzygium grande]|nr:hypothetical protein NL676_024641 [Syzygium grande]
MCMLDIIPSSSSGNKKVRAISAAMPKLKHLEMSGQFIAIASALAILLGCPELELLDVTSCPDGKLDEKSLKDRLLKLKILGPSIDEDYWELGLSIGMSGRV